MFETPRYRRPTSIILGLIVAVGSGFFAFSRNQSKSVRRIDPQIDENAVRTALRLIGWYEQTEDLLTSRGQAPSTLDQSGWEQMLMSKGAIAIDTGKAIADGGIVDAWGNRVIWRPHGDTSSAPGWSLLSVGQNGKNDGGAGDDIVMSAAMVARSKREGVLRALKNGSYERKN